MSRDMESPIDKARGALAAAKEQMGGAEYDDKGLLPIQVHDEVARLMQIANVQAQISIAESLSCIVDHLKDSRFA